AAAFFAVRGLTAALRATGFALVALLALGLAEDFALTARFAFFAAAGLAFEREADRLKPFVRLLLMGGISKGCSPARAAVKRPELTTGLPLNQRAQVFAGALTLRYHGCFDKGANKEKHLMHIVGYGTVRLGLRRLNPPRRTAPTE
ncbi:MAG TPA: hypothetical protein VKA97_10110, partial [Pyrinomonadaceae bacterium]|nr:hypothetical protein [Pyrinomonadaceae bacterium]